MSPSVNEGKRQPGASKRTLSRLLLAGLTGALLALGVVWRLRARASDARQATFVPALPANAHWEGAWTFSAQGADPSEHGEERVSIEFEGAELALAVRRGAYRGTLYVAIDGQPANRLPRDARGAYLLLSAPTWATQVETLTVASGMPDGRHVAQIDVERGWDQWPLIGWAVVEGPDLRPYNQGMRALAALALICLAGALGCRVVESGPRRIDAGPLHVGIEGLRALAERTSLLAVSGLLALLAFYLAPWLPLTALSGAVILAVALLRLDIGLALLAATFPFFYHPRPLLGKAFSLSEIMVLICMLSWSSRQLLHLSRHLGRGEGGIARWIRERTPRGALDLTVGLLVLLGVIGTFTASQRHVALRELRVTIVEPALLYLLLRTSALDEGAVWRIVDGFLLSALTVALIGLAQFATGTHIITAEMGFQRLRSVYLSPNGAGLYMGRALPVLIAMGIWGRQRTRRVTYALAALPVAAAALLSFSKGALLLGIPASLLLMGLLAGRPWSWAALGALALGAIGGLPLLRTPRFASLFDTRSGTTFFRLCLWRSAWRMALDHPWLGVGLDNFLYAYRGRYMLPMAWQEPHLSQAHNILLDFATRLGLAGVAALVWQQTAFWRQAIPLRSLGRRDERALALGLMGSMASFVAHGLVDASYFLVDLAYVLMMTLALSQWLARRRTDEEIDH